ncbi:MAG: thioesterase family protein [Sphingobium sp.]
MNKAFETSTLVRFAHVDSAGIVFYPRYLEMLNGAVEDWCDQALGVDFNTLHVERRIGLPTVRLEVEFITPGRLGDHLTIRISPTQIGRTSCHINVEFMCEGETRLSARVVLVCMSLDEHRACEWPADMRSRIVEELVEAA